MQAFVYILFSPKLDKYYVGSTTDLSRRLEEHNRGKERFTKTGIPWSLQPARKREVYIKKMKSRVFIEKLINSVK